MPDPFDALYTPVEPVAPDAEFTARLRARLARVLDLPRGVTVSQLDIDDRATSSAATSVAAGDDRQIGRADDRAIGRVGLVPHLAVAGARGALAWYGEALGARLRGDPVVMPDGRVGHAELDIGGATLMLSEEHPEIGVAAPEAGGTVPVTLHLEVEDVDAVVARALEAGADLERPAADYEYGRNAVVRDPFGHRWLVSGAPARPGLRHGDLGYVSLNVPDVERAATFFAAVLGWRYQPGSAPQGRQVEGRGLHHGLWGGVSPPTLFCCFAVEDIEAARWRVMEAGGTAGPAEPRPYGVVADCTDDQGTAFALFEPPGGVDPAAEPAANDDRHGDVAYVTMQVVDSAAARAFYGSVLGWRFSPGRVEDGWQVEGVAPMVGLSGGHDRATTVPMYRVDDIEAAVGAVRRAGGTATDPERQPYGTTSTCRDDQGTPFYLGQL